MPDGGNRVGTEGPRQYPPYIADDASRRRWDLCIVMVMRTFEEPEHSPTVWQATRALYFSDLPPDT
jgi:hypothetical protein